MDENKPSVEDVAWVFQKLYEHIADGGGTFRYLIYNRMGFDESAYLALFGAGGLTLANIISDYVDADEVNEQLEII